VAIKFYKDAPLCIRNLLMNESKRQHLGSDFFLKMLKSVAKRDNFKSEERTILVLKNYLNETKPVNEPSGLYMAVETFTTTHGVLIRISNVN
jgi:hypothetical protein